MPVPVSMLSTIAAALVLIAMIPASISAAPNQFAVNVDAEGRALAGFDPVAYFTMGKAAKGNPGFQHTWKGAHWHFASAQHRDRFAADPERFAPRIGGFCAVGAVNGLMQEVDPEMWLIIQGKLYLYLNARIREIARENLEATAVEAESGWQKLRPPAP